MSASFWVRGPSQPVSGRLSVPGDKSIGHRAILLGSLTDGLCEISGLSDGEDNRRTMFALSAMGVETERPAGGSLLVHGLGLRGVRVPERPLDCGNSGTSMRLLAGLLAAQPFAAELTGDPSLRRRPMRRVIEPLERMGARIAGQPGQKAGEQYPPLSVRGGPLRGISYDAAVASAQVKSALLIAGLYAEGPTCVREPGPSRDHTERMLAYLGAPISATAPATVRLDPTGWDRRLKPRSINVPGDPSSAAFVLAAGLLAGVGHGGLELCDVCVNPTRTGFLDALQAMGARVVARNRREVAGEVVADLVLAPGPPAALRGTTIRGDMSVRAIDEVPVVAALAARARGVTVVADAAELRVKESDRIATIVAALRAFGVDAEERPDGLLVRGDPDRALPAAAVNSCGDHRIAMAAAVLALSATGESQIDDVANVATSFPTFLDVLATLGATVRGEGL